MIFVSSQPDSTFFIWQLLTLYDNLKELGVPKEDIHCLIGYEGVVNPEWERWEKEIHATLHFIPDTRDYRNYSVSIRPNIIKKFIQNNPHFLNEYILFHDADILFTDLPIFEGMEDGRIHCSKCDYLDWNYINGKNSPSLMRDLLSVVGIDELTIRMNIPNTGGAQTYAKGLTYEYWDKVERDCHAMHQIYWLNYQTYRLEYNASRGVFGPERPEDTNKFDFQIWTVEMWCMLWNQWLMGYKTFANPDLQFSWPYWVGDQFEQNYIYHNSGLLKIHPKQNETPAETDERLFTNNNWLFKQDYTDKFPNHFAYPCVIRTNGNTEFIVACQRYYIDAIARTANKFWLKDSIHIEQYEKQTFTYVIPFRTYYYITGDHGNINEVLDIYNAIDRPNKEFIILNLVDNKPLSCEQPDVKIINTNVHFGTGERYKTLDEMKEDIGKFSQGELMILQDGRYEQL